MASILLFASSARLLTSASMSSLLVGGAGRLFGTVAMMPSIDDAIS
jgi:hypothetical protein